MEVLRAEDVPERGLRQQPGGVVGVLHVGHRHSGVGHPVVDHGVHGNRHRVFGQDLRGERKKKGQCEEQFLCGEALCLTS